METHAYLYPSTHTHTHTHTQTDRQTDRYKPQSKNRIPFNSSNVILQVQQLTHGFNMPLALVDGNRTRFDANQGLHNGCLVWVSFISELVHFAQQQLIAGNALHWHDKQRHQGEFVGTLSSPAVKVGLSPQKTSQLSIVSSSLSLKRDYQKLTWKRLFSPSSSSVLRHKSYEVMY